MAAITFYADTPDYNTAMFGSGLGFYGSAFGDSVAVAAWQDSTFITDGNGALEGPMASNIKWTHANSGEIQGGASYDVKSIPNGKATVNVKFTHSTAVQVQNVEMRIYDRSNIDSGAVGVTTKAYETIHVNPASIPGGSGDNSWTTPGGSGITLALAQSPGISGLTALDGNTSVAPAIQHDWYVCLSARPDTIGSKTQYGMYVSLEYL